MREFHSFSEDEFGEDGYLADAWGGRDIRLLVDYNGDGLIELSEDAVDEIKLALQSDYETELIEQAAENFGLLEIRWQSMLLKIQMVKLILKMFSLGILKNILLIK